MFRYFLITLFLPYVAMATTARVLIDEKSIHQEIQGSFQLECRNDYSGLRNLCPFTAGVFDSGNWKLHIYKDGLRVTHIQKKNWQDFPGGYFSLKGKIWFKGRRIPRLDVLQKEGRADWVIHLPVDQYLYGVMGSEVPLSWPMNALKAQAIASRTYFLYKRAQSQVHYDVRSDVMDQVFNLKPEYPKVVLKAVNETHNMVLVGKKTKTVFPAYFHSDCGGHTSTEGNVWRKPASLNQPVKDPYCSGAKKNNWSFRIDKGKLLNVLHKAFLLPKGVELKNVLPRIKAEKRAHIIDFLFSNDIVKRMSANEFRKVLGFGKLKSTHFQVRDTWNEVIFSGRGFGHGVGMCQWGAQRWARKGKTYQRILRHYYPTAVLKKVDEKSLRTLPAQATL